jgi:uncharacterized protein (TIGR02145 family)
MKMKKMMLLMLTLLVLGAASMNAQVLIGSTNEPTPGALLELSASSYVGGLLLPRVSSPLTGIADFSTETNAATDLVGLVVYNTTQCKEGVYVWNGTNWVCLFSVSTPAPSAPAAQTLCHKATVVNLAATGTGIKWYLTATDETALESNVALENNKKYYASQTVGECESATRVEVTVTLNPQLLDVDGNEYCYGNFEGAGTWMTENLRVTQYANNTALTHNRTTSNYTDKYYAYPNESASDDGVANGPTHGLLYTWAAATNRTGVLDFETDTEGQTEVPGICPAGWHLPTDYEWNELEIAIANDSEGKYSFPPATTAWQASYRTATSTRGSHGNKMKSVTAPIYDNNEAFRGTSKPAVLGGFDALLAGSVYGGTANNYGTYTLFWSSSSGGSGNAWYRYLSYNNTGVNRSYGTKSSYFSVRCKKN